MAQRLHISDLAPVNTLLATLGLHLPAQQFTSRYNIADLSALWLVRLDVATLALSPAIWGLVPPWAKPGQFPRPLTHARAETVFERASFKNLVRRYRGCVVVNGFYLGVTKRSRQPVTYCYREDDSAIALGALWQYNADGNVELVLLNVAGESADERMPVVIPEERLDEWLTSEDQAAIEQMLFFDAAGLSRVAVGNAVKDRLFDGPECIERVNGGDMSA